MNKQEISFVEDIGNLHYKPKKNWKKYDKHACLKLNLFLYTKDKDFFEGFISPNIQNKRERTITNSFVLNDIHDLETFAKIENIEEFNDIETILMIISL